LIAVDGIAVGIGEQLAALAAHNEAADEAIKALLALASEADESDGKAAGMLMQAIDEIGRSAQAREGGLVLLLAQAQRMKANRGGLGPWLSSHLDFTKGAARGVAQSAHELGHIPELAEPLASGRIGTATIRNLTRTARAVKGTDLDLTETLTATLTLVAEQGVGEANKRVRILE
jgi:hypothetical protein